MKNGSFLSLGSGKLGDIVGYRGQDGRMLQRKRVYEIKNPRTTKQATQRMALAAATSYVRWLTPVVNNSFDGQSNGNKSLNRFRKLLMPLTRSAATGVGDAAFAPKGSTIYMQPIGQNVCVSEGTIINPLSISNGFVNFNHASNFTDAEDYKNFLGSNGLQEGDQITLVSVVYTEDDVNRAYYGVYGRLIFKRAADIEWDVQGVPAIVGNRPNPVLFEYDNVYAAATSSDFKFQPLTENEADGAQAHAVILTRVVDGKQKHSTSFLEPVDTALDGNNYLECLPSYQGAANPAVESESTWYTENAQDPT